MNGHVVDRMLVESMLGLYTKHGNGVMKQRNGEQKMNVIHPISEELKNIVEAHEKWVNEVTGGRRADLRRQDLRNADLRNVYLAGALFEGANLREVNFRRANLERADLREADLSMSDLERADLRMADLIGADFRMAELRWADLRNANLMKADLRGADLRGADLSMANLTKANLEGVNLTATFGLDLACPSDGEFTAWKKADGKLVKLLIPSDAKRSSATSSKCRSDKAIVLGIYTLEGEELPETSVTSDYDDTFTYTVGETVYADSFDDNRFNECSHGIHFFIDRAEAAKY